VRGGALASIADPAGVGSHGPIFQQPAKARDNACNEPASAMALLRYDVMTQLFPPKWDVPSAGC
jgi:hypothetical protein